MAEIRVSWAELVKGVALKTGECHTLVLVPKTSRIRLVGMFFDLDKCFLLPSAMHGIRKIKGQYDKYPDSNLLVVGHTDTSGADSYNLTLSLERADAVAAFLTDDVAAWEAWFGTAKPAEKRWGTREVQAMLTVLPEGEPPYYQGEPNGSEDAEHTAAVKGFQKAQGLTVDGIAGPLTRKALIEAYMGLDGTTLPDGITLTTHGCGESFPADATGDNVRDPDNRRVEVFFFDGPIQPPPPGKTSAKGSTEYPAWLAQVTETIDVSAEDAEPGSLLIRLHDHDAKPLTDVKYQIEISGQPEVTDTSSDGFVTIVLPPYCPEKITVSWGELPSAGGYLYSRDIVPDCAQGTDQEQTQAKLHNLGYPSETDEEFAAAVRAFQLDYQTGDDGLDQGALPKATRDKLDGLYAGDLDATRPPPDPSAGGAASANPDEEEPAPVTLSMDCEL
jgi:hypothetical protein